MASMLVRRNALPHEAPKTTPVGFLTDRLLAYADDDSSHYRFAVSARL